MGKRLLAVLMLAVPLWAQSGFKDSTLTGTASLTLPVSNSGQVSCTFTGSWSGTIQPKVQIATDTAANTSVYPAGSTTSQTTITANGTYTTGIAGFDSFILTGATVTGTAVVSCNRVQQVAKITPTASSMGAVTTTGSPASGEFNIFTGASSIGPFDTSAAAVGDIPVCTALTSTACTTWAVLAGNATGTKVFQENSSGVASWTTAATGTVTSVTLTGDGTVLSSTPSTAVTASGTLNAALATAAANTILGNATGSTATPTYFTLTAPLAFAAGALGCATCDTAAGTLTSTALMTGGGTKTTQTPSATSTLDASGNMSLPGTLGVTGHVTLEGVTSTGATGTGKFVFDAGPTITGHPTVEGVTSTGATGTGKYVFDASPTITGHATIEGVTATGATGTGKLVFDGSPTFTSPTLGAASATTYNGLAITNNGTNTLAIAAGKTFTVSNTLTIAGTDGNTGTIPSGGGTFVMQTATQNLSNKSLSTVLTVGNCAGAGTAANPSVATCSSSAAGAVSCATNASGGTCTVNTSAVTANSEILITQVSDEGTRLTVTCNTTVLALTAPLVSAKSAGTSFTITLPTFSTNPVCFDYVVIN